MYPVQAGDILVIPSSSGSDKFVKCTIKWSQDLGRNLTHDYYTCLVIVEDKDQKVLCFIQADRYQPAGVPADYEVTIDHSWQYGQKNKDGAGRFVVLQNTGYKMHQHRFTTATAGDLALNITKEIGTVLEYGKEMDGGEQLKAIADHGQFAKVFGDKMQTF